MDILIGIGVFTSVLGLIGLVVCMIKAAKIRRAGGEPEEIRAKFQGLVALNMGALFLSVIGLMMIVVGILLGS